MEERCYRIAGITLGVTGQAQWMGGDLVLAPFRIAQTPCAQMLRLERVEELSPPEGEPVFRGEKNLVYRNGDCQCRYEGTYGDEWSRGYLRLLRRGTESAVQFRREQADGKLILAAMELEHRITAQGGILLHSAYIRRKGSAILFTAPSGTGKSTQAGLWVKHRAAELINGDRSAVMVEKEGVRVCGVPYSGSSGVCRNETAPLEAIVYLSQGKENEIRRLSGIAAFRAVWEGCCVNTWNREDLQQCAETVTELIRRVPVYHLSCLPDETAVRALEQAISN